MYQTVPIRTSSIKVPGTRLKDPVAPLRFIVVPEPAATVHGTVLSFMMRLGLDAWAVEAGRVAVWLAVVPVRTLCSPATALYDADLVVEPLSWLTSVASAAGRARPWTLSA